MKPREGWYRDPSRRHHQRYWDGEDWTQRVRDDGIDSVDSGPIEVAPVASPVQSSPDRIGVAVVALQLSAVAYGLFALIAFPLFTEGGEDTSSYALLIAAAFFLTCVALIVGIEVVVSGLKRRRQWAWAAGLAVFGLYIPSLYLPLGAIGIWALLQQGSRKAFGQS